jgi:hypothetical protein
MIKFYQDSGPDKRTLRKLFQGKCSFEEENLIIHWFSGLRHEANLKAIFKQHWDEINDGLEDQELNTAPILDKIHHKIHLRYFKEYRRITFYGKIFRHYSIIAAILFIPLIITGIMLGKILNDRYKEASAVRTYTVYEKESMAEILAPMGSRARFELPDGSFVWLNSGSTLKYPIKFNGPSRTVELCGEAFFDVLTDPQMPFIVKAGKVEIIALGTTFNVSCFLDDDNCEVTLEKGKVIVKKSTDTQEPKRLAELKPGQHIKVPLASNKVQISKEETDKYTSWKEGKLIFRNDPMSNVVKKLGRLYNVEFILKDSKLLDYRFRATFTDESLDEVMKYLSLSSPTIGYIEKERKVTPDGSYGKREIMLYIIKE